MNLKLRNDLVNCCKTKTDLENLKRITRAAVKIDRKGSYTNYTIVDIGNVKLLKERKP